MDVSAPTRHRGRVLAAPADEPRARPRRDAVSLLTIFLVVAFVIPSPLIVKPLGGAGTPADLVALGFLLWWGLAKLGSAQGVDRGRQPVRIAVLLLVLAVLGSVAALFLRPFTTEEGSGAYRGLILIGALVGVTLLAADGISTLDRLHTLMRRYVTGVSLVAAVGLVQWVTGYNPAATLLHPGARPQHRPPAPEPLELRPRPVHHGPSDRAGFAAGHHPAHRRELRLPGQGPALEVDPMGTGGDDRGRHPHGADADRGDRRHHRHGHHRHGLEPGGVARV